MMLHHAKQFIKYCLVGLVNTGVSVLAMFFFSLTGMRYVFYTAIGYALGFIISYFLNFYFTFRCKNSLSLGLAKFLLVNIILFCGAEVIQIILIERLHAQHFLGIGVGMIFYTVTGFFINRYYTFR